MPKFLSGGYILIAVTIKAGFSQPSDDDISASAGMWLAVGSTALLLLPVTSVIILFSWANDLSDIIGTLDLQTIQYTVIIIIFTFLQIELNWMDGLE